MSKDEYEQGVQMGIIAQKLEAIELRLGKIETDVGELNKAKSKFVTGLAWIAGVGFASGAAGSKMAAVLGWLNNSKG